MQLLALVFAALPLFAQTSESAAPSEDGRERTPDVAILANVRAKELRFSEVSGARIGARAEVNGIPAATVATTQRRNLPETVQPSVTYRDIGIRLTITSTLPNIEEILDAVFGETSTTRPSDDPPAADAQVPPAKSAKPHRD